MSLLLKSIISNNNVKVIYCIHDNIFRLNSIINEHISSDVFIANMQNTVDDICFSFNERDNIMKLFILINDGDDVCSKLNLLLIKITKLLVLNKIIIACKKVPIFSVVEVECIRKYNNVQVLHFTDNEVNKINI